MNSVRLILIYVDRVELARCRQGPHEPFIQFYVRQMITSIICGIYDSDTRTKLLAMNPPPSLKEALNLCIRDEDIRLISCKSAKHWDRVNQRDQPRTWPKENDDQDSCGNCGLPSHPYGKTCPAKGQKCSACGKPNHFAPVCRSKINQINDIRRIRSVR